jgi:hypothetical protein
MSTYGRRILATAGRAVMAAASMLAHWKVGGITLAWETIAAAGADTKLPDDTPVRAGQKFLRFGQILCRITRSEVQTIDLSAGDDPTGGTWDITDILGAQVLDIPWDVSAAALQALLRAIGVPYADKITVAKAGFVYTVTFPPEAGNPGPVVVDGGGLASAGAIAVAVATTTAGLAYGGKYGPYDPAANDGRQNLRRGECFILNETTLETGVAGGLDHGVTDHPAVFDGGPTWRARLLITDGAASLAAGPTVADFEAAFPRVEYVQDR